MSWKSNELLAAALEHAERGTPVVPMAALDKYPLLKVDEETGLGGLHLASTDPAEIEGWWQRWPRAGVGLRTGVTFDVIDLDVPTLGELSGTAQQLLEPLRDTTGPLVRSGGGGWHFYVKPSGLGNAVNLAAVDPPENGVMEPGASLPGAGFDVRGLNGLIKAPPSAHPNGRYEILRGFGNELPDFPPKVIAALQAAVRPSHAQTIPRVPGGYRVVPGARRYGQKALDDEMDRLRAVPPGSKGRKGRNDALNRSGFKMFQLVGGGELTEAEVEVVLKDVAREIGLGDREIDATVKSAKDGMDHPRMSTSRARGLGGGGTQPDMHRQGPGPAFKLDFAPDIR